MDAETRYRQLGRLIEEMPEIPNLGPIPTPVAQWMGRADALVRKSTDLFLKADWGVAQGMFSSYRIPAIEQFKLLLFRALAEAELAAPASARGAFIPVGSPFDAFAALGKLLSQAKRDVFIIDPYMDETILTDFETLVPDGVTLRILADEHFYKPSLKPAFERWQQQHTGGRTVLFRLASARTLHDRAIILDAANAWTVTQSLKDFAKRSPAEIINAGDIAALKIPAYEQIWQSAKPA